MVLKTFGSFLLRKIYGFISLFFSNVPFNLSNLYHIFVLFFTSFARSIRVECFDWNRDGRWVHACVVLQKKYPMWEFSHLEKCFFHAQKEAFLVEKNNCGFWKINWGVGVEMCPLFFSVLLFQKCFLWQFLFCFCDGSSCSVWKCLPIIVFALHVCVTVHAHLLLTFAWTLQPWNHRGVLYQHEGIITGTWYPQSVWSKCTMAQHFFLWFCVSIR